ncbi:multidrug transporter MFS superfamily [Vibrio astriarenae]|nr:multidrug transporter MFS superfamily [Vibrio sp. C7]
MCIISGLLKAPDWGILTNQSSLPIPSPLSSMSPALIFIASGIFLMMLFVRHERKFDQRYQSALIPRNWFTNPKLNLGLLLLLTMYLIFGGLNFTLVAYLQVGLSLTAAQTGIIVLTFAISLITSSIFTPRVFERFENSTVACLGFGVCIIGAFLTVVSTGIYTFEWSIYFAMVAFGLGLGMLSSQTVAIITKSVTKEEAERTGGLQATIRNVGLAMGIAIGRGFRSVCNGNQYSRASRITGLPNQPNSTTRR